MQPVELAARSMNTCKRGSLHADQLHVYVCVSANTNGSVYKCVLESVTTAVHVCVCVAGHGRCGGGLPLLGVTSGAGHHSDGARPPLLHGPGGQKRDRQDHMCSLPHMGSLACIVQPCVADI